MDEPERIFTSVEGRVLAAIVNGKRAFWPYSEIMACHRLADRNYIMVEVRNAALAIVEAPKIEQAVAAHGKDKLLQCIQERTSHARLPSRVPVPVE